MHVTSRILIGTLAFAMASAIASPRLSNRETARTTQPRSNSQVAVTQINILNREFVFTPSGSGVQAEISLEDLGIRLANVVDYQVYVNEVHEDSSSYAQQLYKLEDEGCNSNIFEQFNTQAGEIDDMKVIVNCPFVGNDHFPNVSTPAILKLSYIQ